MIDLLYLDAPCVISVEYFENRLVLDLIDSEIIGCHDFN